jgi:hypothetical protein
MATVTRTDILMPGIKDMIVLAEMCLAARDYARAAACFEKAARFIARLAEHP